MEVIELQIFELWKAKYKSFLRKFHGDFAFDRIMEIFELRRFECRGRCISKRYISNLANTFIAIKPDYFY